MSGSLLDDEEYDRRLRERWAQDRGMPAEPLLSGPVSSQPELRNIPRGPGARILGAAGDAVAGVTHFLDRNVQIPIPFTSNTDRPVVGAEPDGQGRVPTERRRMVVPLGEAWLGNAGPVLQNLSYGFTPTHGGGANTRLDLDTLDLLNVVPNVGGASRLLRELPGLAADAPGAFRRLMADTSGAVPLPGAARRQPDLPGGAPGRQADLPGGAPGRQADLPGGAPEPLLGPDGPPPAPRITQDVPTNRPVINPQTGRAEMPAAENLLDVPRERFPHLDTPAPPDRRQSEALLAERMNQQPGTRNTYSGSMDPLANERVVFRGREPREWSPSDWGHYGRQHGVDNLGPMDDNAWRASLREYDAGGGQRISVPGGLETDAPFTYFDQLYLKSQGIDPSQMPRDMHTRLQRRILTTVTPDANDPVAAYNGLMMGFASPNNPLFPNQIAQTRLRARSAEDISRLADMIPWQAGDTVPAAQRAAYNKRIAEAYGLDAGPRTAEEAREAVDRVPGRRAREAVRDENGKVIQRAVTARAAKPAQPARDAVEATIGGTGARGSPDYTRMAEFAQMYRDRPDFFRFNPDPNLSNAENWSRHVERIVSQTPGLSAKTGSFGAVWQAPGTAAISAIDRHMANQIGSRIFPDEAGRRAFEQRVIKNWNDSLTPRQRKTERVRDIDGLLDNDRGSTFFQDALLTQVGQHSGARVRTPKGTLNPNLPAHLTPQEANWIREPTNVTTLGRFYREALSENARMAESEGLGLFGSQWLNWDRIRRRLEPHENMNPVLARIPAMSLEQLQDARLMHRAMGSTDYRKLRPTAEQEAAALRAGDSVNSSPRLRPTSRVGNPSGLGYFAVPPALLGGSLLGDDDERR